jgi:endonuclease III
MKDSKLYTEKIKRLHRTLKRTGSKIQPVTYEDPLEALVFGLLSEPVTESQAQTMHRRLTKHFVDLNDVRVAKSDEIADLCGEDSPAVREAADRLTRVLMAVFNRFHVLTLAGIRKLGKRPAKQLIEALDGVTPFAVHYCMLTSLQGHAVPLTARMIDYLKAEHLIHPQSDPEDTEGFLAKLVPAKEGYEFYSLLRAQSEAWRPSEKRASGASSATEAATKKEPKKK